MELEFLGNILGKMADNAILTLTFVFASSCLQQLFPPYPGDSVMVLCGLISGERHMFGLPLYLTFLGATLLSSALVFELGVRRGRKVLSSALVKKWFSLEMQVKVIEKLQKHNTSAFLVCKFLPGCNTAALILGGAGGMDRRKTYFSIGMAAFLHNSLFFCLGVKMSDNSAQLARILRQTNAAAWIFLASIMVIYFVIRWVKKRKVGGN